MVDEKQLSNSPSSNSSSWLNNQEFSGNLRELFSQIADSNCSRNNINDSPVTVTNRPSALDYFDSSDSDIEDDEELHIKNNITKQVNKPENNKQNSPIQIDHNDEYIWIEKDINSNSNSNIIGKRKRITKESNKPNKKRKKSKKDQIYSTKSSKKKLKEKEKLLKLEEKINRGYKGLQRSANYHWGTVVNDPNSPGEFISIKENPLKSDNEYYFWDSKADKELLMYERIYSNHVPSYYHAPKRFLGLKSNESVRYLKQHQTYVVTRTDISSSQNINRYFTKSKRKTKTIKIIPEHNKSIQTLEYLPLEDDNISKNNTTIDSKEELFDDYHMRKTEELSKYTQTNPNDIDGWIRFIEFQDEILNSSINSYSKKSIIEKKISIYLSALQKNENSDKLLLGYLDCINQIWDTEKLISLWEKIMIAKKYNIIMWEHYISFRLSNFSSFSVYECRKIFLRAINAMYDFQIYSSKNGNLNDAIKAEEYQLEFFRRYCLFEAQCGYMERAISLYQAMIEFNIYNPSHLEEYESRIKLFESFWDSEVPRIGEENAKGWDDWINNLENKNSTNINNITKNEYELNIQHVINNIKDKDSFTNKLLVENLLHPLWQPKRSIEHDEDLDMECVILFNDIEEYILPIRMEIFKVKLICNFINFLISTHGGNSRLLIHNSDGNELDNELLNKITKEIESVGHDLCEILPQHEDIIANSIKPSTEIESKYQKLLPKEYSLFDSFTTPEDILISNDLSKFISRLFKSILHKFPGNSVLSNLYIDFELYYNTSPSCNTIKQKSISLKNTCKLLLSNRGNDLQLWNRFAKSQCILNRITEAKRIYDTALSMSNISTESYPLIAEYALLELNNPTFNNDKIKLMRVLSILISCWETKFQSILTKRKDNQKYNIDNNFNNYSILPLNIFPKLPPTKILQIRTKTINILNKLKSMIEIPQSYYVDNVIIILLFEYLYKNIETEISLFDEILNLNWKHLIFKKKLLEFQLSLLEYHSKSQIVPPIRFRILLEKALQLFPSHPKFLSSFIQHESRSQLQNRLRRYFDKFCNSQSSPIIWLFAIKSETNRIGTYNRIIALFERALEVPNLSNCSLLWRSYIQFHIQRNEKELAKRIYFRAIRTIPTSKSLWILCTKIGLSTNETTDILNLMIEKEIRLRITL